MPPRTQSSKDANLIRFYLLVRSKESWKTKILDDKLALKWAISAKVAIRSSRYLKGEQLEAVSELRRLVLVERKYDQELLLNPQGDSISQYPEITSVDSDFINALKYARGSKYALREPELTENGTGILVSDNLVPESVHKELARELNALAAKEPQDFRPGSFGKIQDLIHPSLYPYVPGVTRTLPNVKLPPLGDDGQFETKVGENELESRFAWIPSVFKVSPDGTDVHIESYINGLGSRGEHPRLFRAIEKLFLLALPHFEKTMKISAKYKANDSPSVKRWRERRQFAVENKRSLSRSMWNEFLDRQQDERDVQELEAKQKLQQAIREEEAKRETFSNLGDSYAASDMFKGKEMKVIVKATNYTLKPGQIHGGSWHTEGMPHERIVASVIYYYDTDEAIEDGGLGFIKSRDDNKDFPSIKERGQANFKLKFVPGDEGGGDEYKDQEEEDHYPSDWETYSVKIDSGFRSKIFFTDISLGTVPTTNINRGEKNKTGRIVSFPNWIKHRVASVKNTSVPDNDNQVATRKILSFFLIDDTIQNKASISYHGLKLKGLRNMNVLTTSQIPMQMRKCNERTLLALLPRVCAQLTGTALPLELATIIWSYVADGTLSREEAESYRLELIDERKFRPVHYTD